MLHRTCITGDLILTRADITAAETHVTDLRGRFVGGLLHFHAGMVAAGRSDE